MKRSSILFLSNAYPDFETSTHGIFIREMALWLQKKGYRISVVSPKIFRRSRYVEEQDGINVYRFPFFARNKQLIEYDRIPYVRMVLYYLSGFIWALYVLLRRGCQLIHVHWAIPTGLIAILAGTIFRRPVIVTIHGSDFRLAMGKSSLLKRAFFFVCRRATHINCVSRVMEEELKQMGIKGKKISSFPMGVEEAFFEGGRRREKKLEGRPFLILSNRNLLPIYNVSLLIRAIPLVLKEEPHTKFLIAGDGSERENLEKEARNLRIGSSVVFLGRIPHSDMPTLLAEADIYVSTSLSDGTSVSLLEAMGSGAFPIVTDILSNREWIADGVNGFLVSPESERNLAGRIIEVIRNRTLIDQAHEKNQKLTEERARWLSLIRRIDELYQGCK